MMQAFLVIPISAIIGALGAWFISKVGSTFGLMDVSNRRSSHVVSTTRAGGIGILVVFIIASFFAVENHLLLLFLVVAGFLGLVEDRFSLPSIFRLSAQLVLSCLLAFRIFGKPTSVEQLFFILFWIIFITGTANFYNFMDGIDGIAGLTGVVNFALFSTFSFYFLKDSNLTYLTLAISSACAGFLSFNFPYAKVFMGDVGSILLGFASATLVAKTSSNISIFLCLIMFLCTFYADALVTLFYRWKRRENLMQAHRSHLYQYMSNELRIPHWKVSLGYAIVQLVFGVLAILMYQKNILFQLSLMAIFGFLFLMIYNKIKTLPVKAL